MTKSQIHGKVLLGFALGLVVGMAIIGVVAPSILKNVPKTENQEFAKVFEKENIKLGISINETVPREIKETVELLVERFINQLAWSVTACETKGTTEFLTMTSDALDQLLDRIAEKLNQKNSETP
jgi:hypothetical protein